MLTQQEKNVIILDSFQKLSYKTKCELLSGADGGAPRFKKYGQNLIKTLGEGVYNKIRESFSNADYARRLFSSYEEEGITPVTYLSERYPEQLKNTPAPPLVLYCKGDVSLLKKRLFGVVGSRRTTANALVSCKRIVEELCGPFTVVTGIADGADTAVVQTALERGGAVCVLAHGFHHVYPAINKRLLDAVYAGGLAVTECLPEVQPKKYLFPARNRIIAGLSEGVLVVSAGKKSGALITAQYAYDYGREIFAFPYNINVTSGAGCNALIKKGAYLTENILDIAAVFGLDLNTQNSVTLSGEEKILLDEIRAAGDVHISVLCTLLGKQPYELLPLLSSLEVKKLIARLGGNRYSAV